MRGLIVAALLLLCQFAWTDISVTMHADSDPNDLRMRWHRLLLNLALERTVEEYGSYTIKQAPDMALARRWSSLKNNKYTNYIFFDTYHVPRTTAFSEHAIFVDFPMLMGLLGYRICFHSAQKADTIQTAVSKNQIKNLTIGQGRDWTDTPILRHNGYKVIESHGYNELFKMTRANRFDLFCRSVHEIYDEYHFHKDAKGLLVEQNFAFYYPIPIFIYTHKDNHLLAERLKKGLELAFQDGSITAAFEQHMGERIKFTRLSERKIIQLENPLLKGLNGDYERYNYPMHSLPAAPPPSP